MIPTLIGRWQGRLFLFSTVGVLVTAIFGALYDDFQTVFALLAYVLLFGFGWDGIYRLLALWRWDADWPPALVVANGIGEGIFIWLFVKVLNTPPGVAEDIRFTQFLAHYVTTFAVMFIVVFSLLRILFPRGRFSGGRIGYSPLTWGILLALPFITIGLPLLLMR